MPDEELESYLAAISPEVDTTRSELTGRFGSAEVFQVRLPALRIEQLRRLAQAHGVPPTSLVVDWVVERLEQEDPGLGSPVPRAPIATRVDRPGGANPVGRGPVDRRGPVDPRSPLGSLIPGNPMAQGNLLARPSSTGPRPSVGQRPEAAPQLPGAAPQLPGAARQPAGAAPQSRTTAPHSTTTARLAPTTALLSPITAPLSPAAASLSPTAAPLPPPSAGATGQQASPPVGPGGTSVGSFLPNGSYAAPPAGAPAPPGDSVSAANRSAPGSPEPTAARRSEQGGEPESEPNAVTPIFRAGTELPDPEKSRGPRHRAPEPVTSLLTRRKF